MTQGRRPRLGSLILIVLALAAFFLCADQVRKIGLLADDYFAVKLVADHVEQHPGLVDRLATTFTRRWAPDSLLTFWHRPMLALGVQLDYALFGTDGKRHHLTSILLWILLALATSALSRQILGPQRPTTAMAIGAVALLYPAGVEALGWLVARDDIMFALFGALALRARLARRRSPVAGLFWLILALFSKESASVLVPLLNLAGFLVPPRETTPPLPRNQRLIRELAPWFVLAAWLAVRYSVLGSLGTSYGSANYFADFDLGRTTANLGRSLFRLLVPVNETAFTALGLPRSGLIALRAAFLVPAAFLLACGLVFARQPGDVKRAFFLVAALVAPLVFLSPVFVVSLELNGGRGLVFPAVCWTTLLGLGFDRTLSRPALRVAAISALAILLVLSFGCLFVALMPYVHATNAAEAVVRSLDVVPPGDQVVLLRTYDPEKDMRPDLIYQTGAYVISDGIRTVFGPPFRRGPAVLVTLSKSDGELLAAPDTGPRPWLAFLLPETVGDPLFRILARGGSEGSLPEMTPRHGATLDAGKPLTFRVRVAPDVLSSLGSMSITAVDPDGREAHTDLTAAELQSARNAGGALEIPATRLSQALDLATLRAAKVRVFVWWAEGRSAAGSIVFRSPWQAVAVPGGA